MNEQREDRLIRAAQAGDWNVVIAGERDTETLGQMCDIIKAARAVAKGWKECPSECVDPSCVLLRSISAFEDGGKA